MRKPPWKLNEVEMKFVYILILIFVLYSNALSQQQGGQGHSTISSEIGSVTVSCEEEMCALSVNGEIIQSDIYHMGDMAPIFEHIEGEAKDIFLINLYHGDGCPVMYEVVHLSSEKHVFVSEPFGNCNTVTAILFEGVGIILEFPGLAEAQREKKTYLYSLAKQKIICVKSVQ